jgi:hypothetical protein
MQHLLFSPINFADHNEKELDERGYSQYLFNIIMQWLGDILY